jgi:nucleoside phosphorylase
VKYKHIMNAQEAHLLLTRLHIVTATEALSALSHLVECVVTALQDPGWLVRQGVQLLLRIFDRLSTKETIPFSQQADACIMCALEEEVAAVEEEVSARCQVAFATGIGNNGRFVYRYTTITNTRQEPLTLLLLCQTRPGPIATALDVKALLQGVQPRFIAMSGICAGDKQYLQLGDLVVAEYAYHYHAGKMEHGPQGVPIHRPEWITYGPAKQILHCVRSFTAWAAPVGDLRRPDQTHELPKRFVTAMASGMTVQSADPFPALQQHNHKTWALDMEAAAFYQTLQDFPQIASLVVKGVSDYADTSKNDQYHAYAARASAIYLLSFIQEYIFASRTQECSALLGDACSSQCSFHHTRKSAQPRQQQLRKARKCSP